MLYDNAQLAMIYLRAAHIFNEPIYRNVAIETLDFMWSEMRDESGLITSISALDDKGKEGGAYLWTEEQLKAVLDNDDFRLVSRIWGMDTPSEYESGYLPLIRKEPSSAEQKRLQVIYPKLLLARNMRVSPKDTKSLVGLNGLALAAFSEAADIAPRYRLAADELRSFIVEKMWQNRELQKGISNQKLLGQADLEGYAYAASGLLRYAQVSKNIADLKLVNKIAQTAWLKFYTPRGFLLEQNSELAKPYYQVVIEDGPLPSPSSVLIDVSIRTGDRALKKNAENALGFSEALHSRGLFWNTGQVRALGNLFSVGTSKH